MLAGNRVVPGMAPYAACYGGHQFGTWAGQLGDGRAITLGEVGAAGRDGPPSWELQLKGAGPTPYSRRADGRAVLRSSLRELVCSEAMHHLGVPTTRALSLVTTGEPVLRDLLYDGHPELRARRGGVPGRAVVPAVRQLRDPQRARRSRHPAPARAVHAGAPLLEVPRRRPARHRRLVRRGRAAHRVAGLRVDAGRLRPRRDEHRQHVDPRADDRLRPVRLDRAVRSGLDAEHHGRVGQALPVRQPAGGRALEPRAAGRRARAAGRRPGAAAPHGRAVRRRAGVAASPRLAAQARADRPRRHLGATTTACSPRSARCWSRSRPT